MSKQDSSPMTKLLPEGCATPPPITKPYVRFLYRGALEAIIRLKDLTSQIQAGRLPMS